MFGHDPSKAAVNAGLLEVIVGGVEMIVPPLL